MQPYEIRPAEPADLGAVVDSSAALFADDAGTRDATISQTWIRTEGAQRLSAAITDPSRLILLAVQGDAVIGHLTAALSEPVSIRPITLAKLQGLYVYPQYRSGGVGEAMVARFYQWARERGVARMTVDAFASNERAIQFYQRVGFTPYTLTLEAEL